jgi:hypothetical protein
VADGDLVTLDVLKPETRRACKEIPAAAIVDGIGRDSLLVDGRCVGSRGGLLL